MLNKTNAYFHFSCANFSNFEMFLLKSYEVQEYLRNFWGFNVIGSLAYLLLRELMNISKDLLTFQLHHLRQTFIIIGA